MPINRQTENLKIVCIFKTHRVDRKVLTFVICIQIDQMDWCVVRSWLVEYRISHVFFFVFLFVESCSINSLESSTFTSVVETSRYHLCEWEEQRTKQRTLNNKQYFSLNSWSWKSYRVLKIWNVLSPGKLYLIN